MMVMGHGYGGVCSCMCMHVGKCVFVCRLFNVLNVLILFSYFSKNVELFHDLRHSRFIYPGRELCCKMVKVGENRKIEQTKKGAREDERLKPMPRTRMSGRERLK